MVELHDEVAALRAEIVLNQTQLAERDARLAELDRRIDALITELKSATLDNAKLQARLKELLSKRRALENDAPGQLVLAFHGENALPTPPCANEAPDGETAEDKLRPRHVRKNAPRTIAYAALPREHVQHELPVDERVCQITGKPLVVIGEKTSEELDFRPAKLVVVVHHRALYGLSEEDQRERKIEPVLAPLPAQPIEGASVGAGLLAWILVQKYCHHLPLYRQQAIFEREGLFLPRQSMCDWYLAGAFNLAPIQQALRRRIATSGVVQLDDTPLKCQGSKGETIFQAHLWTYSSPVTEGVVFDFTSNRGHEHVLDFLGSDIQGYLVGDGYAGYGTIAKKCPGVIEAGCWAHAVRYCREAIKESPAEGSQLVAAIGPLFAIEAEALQQKLTPSAVHDLRQQRSRPVLKNIRELIEAQQKLPRSLEGKMHKALRYLVNQWDALIAFLEDGRVPIHNNSCERAIRPVAIGRKNWLFAGSERGGEAAAIVYSLVESCRRAHVDPYEYLKDVLVRVATHPAARVDELTPDRWKALFGVQAKS